MAKPASTKRFKIALSFPGERREYVSRVAEELARRLGQDHVFYDNNFMAELARPDLDSYLQEIYHDESELIVVFLCADYDRKEWCGLEWRAIRDLIKKRQASDIMPFRFDRTEIEGLFSIDGYIDAGQHTPTEAAELILERYELNQENVSLRSHKKPGAAGSRKDAPAQVQVLHSLPFESLGSLFKGRDEALAELHGALAGGATTAIVQKRAIHGLGGVGKTRLAVEYGWRYAAEYKAVLFVTADSPSSLRANLAALAGPAVLNLPEQDLPEEDKKVGAVLRWLKETPGWLLVLDNADSDEAAKAVQGLLPQLGGGRVLITTRRAHWDATIRKHALDKLEPDRATEFLLERTEHGRLKKPDDAACARELAERLDGLPLALELAGAYVVHMHCTFEAYLKRWDTEREKVLA